MVNFIYVASHHALRAPGSLGFGSVAHESVRCQGIRNGLAVMVDRIIADTCGDGGPHNMNDGGDLL